MPQGTVVPTRPPRIPAPISFSWMLSAFFIGWIWGFTGDSAIKDIFVVLIGLLPSAVITVALLSKTKSSLGETMQGLAEDSKPASLVLVIAMGLAIGVTLGIYARNSHFLGQGQKPPVEKIAAQEGQ